LRRKKKVVFFNSQIARRKEGEETAMREFFEIME
jgi:hypothetical protein